MSLCARNTEGFDILTVENVDGHTHTHTHTHARMHARTHVHAHTHTHTHITTMYMYVQYCTCIVHPERFRSNAQNAIAFARRNRTRVKRNDAFACVYLRSLASTVRDRPRARTCMRTRVRTYILPTLFSCFISAEAVHARPMQ